MYDNEEQLKAIALIKAQKYQLSFSFFILTVIQNYSSTFPKLFPNECFFLLEESRDLLNHN